MTEIPVHPLFRDRPPPEAKLWRYLSFAKFVAFLDANQLHLTRVDQFDDHFEGAWPKQDFAKWEDRKATFDMNKFTERGRKLVAVSCWIESKHESAAMWRLYAPGNEGVAIVTSFQKLDEVVTSQGPQQLPDCLAGTGRVRYLDHFTEGLLENGSQNALLPFMLKNISYEHEREVRALVNARFDQEIPAGGLDLPVQLTSFIDEIVTSPFAQPWFDKTVRGVGERYGLGDRIRSSLLSPANFYMARSDTARDGR
jgi:hypothetical protein